MHRRLLSTALAGLCGLAWIPSGAEGAWRVDPDQGSDANDGSAWTADGEGAGPMLSIQAAVDAAFAGGGGEVWLKKGTHRPATAGVAPQLTNCAVVMASGVSLMGGFAGTENDAADRGGYVPYDTIIDVSTANAGNPAFHGIAIYQKTNVQVEGLTVTGAVTDSSNAFDSRGGGFNLVGTNDTVAIRNCWIVGNRIPGGNGYGAGLYLSGSSGIFEDLLIAGNDAGARIGAGVFMSGSAPTVLPVFRRCVFSGNSGGDAGAVYQEGGSNPKRFVDCIFAGNRGSGRGGALFLNTGTVEAVNCLLVGNRSNFGGGVYHSAYSGGTLRMTNCTVAGNTSTGIWVTVPGGSQPGPHTLTLRNVLFSGNSPFALVEASADADVTELSNCLFNGSATADFLSEGTTNLTGAAAINALSDGTIANNVDGDPAFLPSGFGVFESVVLDGSFVRLTDNDPEVAPFTPGAMRGGFVRPDTTQPYILYIIDNTEDTITTIAAAPIASTIGANPSYNVLAYQLQTSSAARDVGADFTAGAPETVADFDGYPRPAGAGFDIGAFEVHDKVGTSIAIVADSPDPSLAGSTVAIEAQISVPGGTPTGLVEFFADGNSIGFGPVGGGMASLETTALPAGSVSLTAHYPGNAMFTESTSPTEPHEVLAGADLMEVR